MCCDTEQSLTSSVTTHLNNHTAAISELKLQVKELTGAIENSQNPLLEEIKSEQEVLKKDIAELRKGFEAKLETAVTKLAESIDGVEKKSADESSKLVAELQSISAHFTKIEDNLSLHGTKLNTSTMERIAEALMTLRQAITTPGSNVESAVQSSEKTVARKIKESEQTITKSIDTRADEISDGLIETRDNLRQKVDESQPRIVGALDAAIEVIAQSLENSAAESKDELSEKAGVSAGALPGDEEQGEDKA